MAVGTGIISTTTASAAAAQSTRVGAAPSVSARAVRLGALSGATVLNADVTLSPRNPSALATFATAVSTPGNPLYGHYLARGQFANRFGPTMTAIATVEAELRADGLTPGRITSNHLTIPVRATAARFATAFSTSFDTYRLPTGRVAYANTQAPRFSGSAARYVQGVVGLDNLALPRPLGLERAQPKSVTPSYGTQQTTGGPEPCAAALTAGSHSQGYTVNQLASAYNFSGPYAAGDEGQGITVAVYELAPDLASDIAAYQSCYGTNATVEYRNVDGGPGTTLQTNGGSAEADLDIENIIGFAPKATVEDYQAPASGGGDIYTAWADDDTAQVMSISWGACEADMSEASNLFEGTIFEQAAAQGQSVFAASGDSGSSGCAYGGGGSQLAVSDPSSQPYVTGVGGTQTQSTTAPPVQRVWNDSGGAGGGGVSASWAMPSYQSGAPSSLNVVNSLSSGSPCLAASGSYCREVPDVSADASQIGGYLIYYDGSWIDIGGTSGGAPLWAALTAITDASTACGGRPIGFANPALYGAAAASYASNFFDVTNGNNADHAYGYTGSLYPSTTGYDMASGLGTPNAANLPTALCQAARPVTVTPPGNQTSQLGGSVSLQIQASDFTGAGLTFSATGLPAGLSISPSGLVSGSPTTARSSSVTVTAQDSTGASASISFMWTVTPVPSGELAWGFDSDGELGNGTTATAQTTPVGVSLPAGVTATAISAGGLQGYAIGSNGTLYAWGDGANGQLGNGTTTEPQTTPVAVSLPAGVTPTAIAAGAMAGYAIGSNGTLYAWGDGQNGQLGNGTTTVTQSTPVAVSLPAGVTPTAIAAAGSTGYAIGSNGTLYAWGYGTDGELGNGTTTATQSTPVAVSLPAGVTPTAIAGGASTGYALGSNGTLYAWGAGTHGQLGNGTTPATQSTPVAVSLPAGVTPTAIAAGQWTGYATGSNGTLYAWGYGTDGELGNGTTTAPQTTPVAVSLPGGVTPTAIAASEYSGYAIGSNGTLYAWGYDTDGELGNGTAKPSQTTPVAVSLPTGTLPTGLGAESQSETDYALVRPPTVPTITSANSATFTQGAAGSFTVTGTGPPGPTFSETGTLPAGVTLSSTGVLAGTPTQSGSFPITLTATNGVSPNATQSFTLLVKAPPTITSATSATFAAGVGNSFTVTATGGPAPTFTETGTLPAGVTLSSAGVVSGTPTQSGSFPITLTATNGVSPNATQSFTLTVNPQAGPAPSGELAWGWGVNGALGNDTTSDPQSTPVGVSLPAGVTATAIAAGSDNGYAIGSNGTLYAWGYGADGELGNGTTTEVQTTPVAVSLPPGVTPTAIAANGSDGYALASNGTLYAWGYGMDGELGNGTTTFKQTTPVAVSLPTGVTVTAIAASAADGYALGSNGTVYAWGYGINGELGNGTTTDAQATPVAVSLPAGVTATAISTGQDTGYAIGSNGTVYAWGYGAIGELGTGTGATTKAQTTPVAVSMPAGVTATAISGGGNTAYAIGSDGTLYAWGWGNEGELGDGTLPPPDQPWVASPVAVSLPAGVTATAIAGASEDGYAVGSDGNEYAWGYGTDGELGNGTTPAAQATPVVVSLPAGFTTTTLAQGPVSTTGYAIVQVVPITVATWTTSASYAAAEQAIPFAYLVTNNSAVAESGVSVATNLNTVSCPSSTLAVGASETCLGAYVTTPADLTAGSITDTAMAAATGPTPVQSFPSSATISAQNCTNPVIFNPGPGSATAGKVYGFTVTTCSATVPTISAGGLPAGLKLTNNLNGTATIAGVPKGQGGVHTVTISAAVSGKPTAKQITKMTVYSPPVFSSANYYVTAPGTPFTFTVSTKYSYPAGPSISSPSTPPGVQLFDNGNGTATLSGTVGTTGAYPITLQAYNGIGGVVNQAFTLYVFQAPAITSGNAITATAGTAITPFAVTATGFPAPTFKATGLPTGLTLSPTGTLSGTPSKTDAGGVDSVKITATSYAGTATQTLTVTLYNSPAFSSPAAYTATTGTAFTYLVVTANAYPTPVISTTSTLPSGVTLLDDGNGTATLGGTPAAGTGGTHTINISASNGIGSAVVQKLTLTIDQPPAITSASSLSTGVGVAMATFTVTATGFPKPIFSAAGLPAGLTLSTVGKLTGTPLASDSTGAYPVTITASSVAGTAVQNFTLTLTP